jgi:uncharacterized membrane protein
LFPRAATLRTLRGMSPQFYYVLHVGSVFLMMAVIFAIFGGASDSRRKLLMGLGGVGSLLALIAAVGLLHKVHQQASPMSWPLWVWVKILCWLWLSAVGGIAYRRRSQTPSLVLISGIATVVALVMVYYRPFLG